MAVFKPAVSGLSEERSRPITSGSGARRAHIRPTTRSRPTGTSPAVSPHLAAEMAGEPIDVGRLREGLAAARSAGEFLVCEGVGGFLVPLRHRLPGARLCRATAACRSWSWPRPGSERSTTPCSPIESVRAAGLDVRAVVLTPWPDAPKRLEVSNRETIERLGEVEVRTVGLVDPDEPDAWPSLVALTR